MSLKGHVLTRLRSRYTDFAAAAVQDDLEEQFPKDGISILRETGCLRAVLPRSRGGMGLGWKADGDLFLFNLLRAVGGAHLSCARLYEGHVNAFQLLWTFGNPTQRDELCGYVDSGELLGVWNAPSPAGELLVFDDGERLLLVGSKAYASGAGGIRRPLVTARHAEWGLVMVWPDSEYSIGPLTEWLMHGMRASMTCSVGFNSEISPAQIFGQADDYHAQPQFSGGSWRFLAAQLGAGEAIVEVMRAELVRRGRTEDPHQRARMTQCATALETSAKWVRDSMRMLSDSGVSIEQIIQHANGARVVVERALLTVIETVQRSVGLQLFSRTHPCERMMRDLATYLRQPAPDALLESIGKYAFSQEWPSLSGGKYDGE